ncbi:hypothetical protein [Thalassotalea sp. PS06]|uniref:hypothetical protein n=1 Tax=Thalassotalea sp. PS06 TaxID=2594005 RepID=UPI0011631FCF|nr:hypothetical protein [Thalassotalea sp. PS06]QDP01451.1 hypothetical protein FNC98_08980 [Thalassotalea sp. PS06]
MFRSILILASAAVLSACGGSKDDTEECPTVVEPVVIPAISVNFFDMDMEALNVCDAIVTISSPDNSETIYGSALSDCENTNSIVGGYDLVGHDVLVEKAGFVSQSFEEITPIETTCSYETYELDVYLDKN